MLKKIMALSLSFAIIISMAVSFYPIGVSASQTGNITLGIDNRYILTNTNQSISLTDVNVILDSSSTVTADQLTWAPADSGVSIASGVLTATQKGVHKVTISKDTFSLDVYIVAKDATDNEYVLYDENFDNTPDGTLPAGWSRLQGTTASNAAVQNKQFVMDARTSPDNPSIVKLPDYLNVFGDYHIQADVTMAAVNDPGRWCSIMYRIQNLNAPNFYPYYQMCVRQNSTTGDGVEFAEKTPAGAWNVAVKAPSLTALDSSKRYRFDVVAKGNEVQESINNKVMIDTNQATDLKNGGIGLQANGSKVIFDNLKVTIPANTVTVGVNNRYILTNINQSINLSNISVAEDSSTTVTGDQLTWATTDSGLTVANGILTALQNGVHKVTVSRNSFSTDIYVVAKGVTDNEYVLYDENLDNTPDGTLPAGWSRLQGTTASNAVVQNKQFVMDARTSPDNPSIVKLPDYLNAFGDYHIQADVTMAAVNDPGRWCSIMYRIQNLNAPNFYPYYQMCVRQNSTTGDGVEFAEKTPAGAWNVAVKAPTIEPLDASKSYHFDILAQGTNIKESINGKVAIDTNQATDLKNGGIGLQANGSKIIFDNIKVTIPAQNDNAQNGTVFDDNNVVLKFATLSDTHLQGDNSVPGQKLAAALAQENAKANGNLDALLITGDLTDSGKANQYQELNSVISSKEDPNKTRYIFALGNHEYFDSIQNGATWEGGNMLKDAFGDAAYKGATAQEINDGNYHTIVNGYHYIVVNCAQYDGGVKYRAEDIAWLKTQLQQAAADDPNKPIFVASHPMITGTSLGSNMGAYWAATDLSDVLKDYPQSIYFCGHLHFPENDERAIWQGAFTTIEVGSTYYASNQPTDADNGNTFINNSSGFMTDDSMQTSQGLYVEVDKNNNVKVTRMDFANKSDIKKPWIIPAPKADNSQLNCYTPYQESLGNTAPIFPADATFTEVEKDTDTLSYKFQFTQATDNDLVYSYQISFLDKLTGKTMKTISTLSDFYLHPNQCDMASTITKTVTANQLSPFSLSDNDYIVQVVAVDCFGAKSEPVTAEIQSGSNNNNPTVLTPVTAWDGSKIPVGTLVDTPTDKGPDGDIPWFSDDGSKNVANGNLTLKIVSGTGDLGAHCLQATVNNQPDASKTYEIPYLLFNTDFKSQPSVDASGATAFQFYYDGSNYSDSTQPYFTLGLVLNDFNKDGTPAYDDDGKGNKTRHIACWDASKSVLYQDANGLWASAPVNTGYMFSLPIHYKGWVKVPVKNLYNMVQWGEAVRDIDGVFSPKSIKSINLLVSGVKNVNAGKSFYIGNMQFLVPAADPAVTAVVDKINALPANVTLNDTAAVMAARVAYNSLTANQQAQVTNISALTVSETKLAQLQADKNAADPVVAAINSLPANVTVSDAAAVTAARAAYNSLTADQKLLVTDLGILSADETKLAQLTSDKAAADLVIAKISAIPSLTTLTIADKAKVTDADTAFNTLTETQKALITNHSDLEAAKAKINLLQAAVDNVIALINAISSDYSKVAPAKAAYDALSPSQQNLVTNANILIEDEKIRKDSSTGIIITGDNLPADATIKVTFIDSASDGYKQLQKQLTGNYILASYEISLNSGNTEIEPNGLIKISIPLSQYSGKNNILIAHIKDNGSINFITPVIDNGIATFITDSLSKYAIVTTSAKDTGSYNITTDTSSKNPNTGDNSPVTAVLFLGAVSLATLVFTVKFAKNS